MYPGCCSLALPFQNPFPNIPRRVFHPSCIRNSQWSHACCYSQDKCRRCSSLPWMLGSTNYSPWLDTCIGYGDRLIGLISFARQHAHIQIHKHSPFCPHAVKWRYRVRSMQHCTNGLWGTETLLSCYSDTTKLARKR